ncbi:FAD assembly factor SdhE [Alkalimarinus alittae]|uniref:FAD assembly factor SdhE n=1 Tax=Alkalimarinus alittae TaxID=2961619 RepID=A0ABY6MZF9_9ALTE|nr:succinate dehydrogenase assembly factor 2 [Alkalimarinus alittae]UZE95236.1 succinate dehydrogenase assembly factor 2 [Alkalimarinus alittae]
MVSDSEFNRLFWHSRRGMLELDVLLVPFLKEAFRDLPPEDQARYVKLLECEDQDMFGWFMQKGTPEDPDLAKIVKIILDRVQPE